MKLRYIAVLAVLIFLGGFWACKKNKLSNIPHIDLRSMYPDSIQAGSGTDTLYILFGMQDGDADLGNDQTTVNYDIWIKDKRFDTGYSGYFFPQIDTRAENPSTGVVGTCLFKQVAAFITPRPDSIHMHYGDTTSFELYIVDRAGHQSNHITTGNVFIKP